MDGKNIIKNKLMNKRGQITLFVIIAIVIIAAIVFIFLFYKSSAPSINTEENPEDYIEKCISDSLVKAEKIILEGNGYVNITDNYILYSQNRAGEKVPYLCKASRFYEKCVNQEPMFMGLVSQEMNSLVKPDTEKCFADLVQILKNKGYNVKEGTLNLSVNFEGKSIVAEAKKSISIIKGENSRSYEKFHGKINSPIYRLADTARNIVNYESELCEFNIKSWTDNYRDVSIKLFVTGDQSKIYTLTEENSGKQMSFAIRTCVLPAGI